MRTRAGKASGEREPGGLAAVVLAAGRSKRFRSAVPKVLHPAAGRPIVLHVLEALRELHRRTRLSAVVLVVPPGGQVEQALADVRFPFPVVYAVQRQPRGTGDAVRRALGRLDGPDEVLVCAGDAPLVRTESLRALVRERRRRKASAAVLTAVLADGGAYGRVVRRDGYVEGIVEARDASRAQLAIREVNTGTFVFAGDALARTLPALRSDNAQGEYYLTDAVRMLATGGGGVAGIEGAADEGLGVNTRAELADVVRRIRERICERLMSRGVTILDPAATYVDAGVAVGADTLILPGTLLEGSTRVGRGCEVGPSVRLVDTRVGDAASVSFAVARGARIGAGAEVGPYASLREGTTLEAGAKVGTFVETKAAHIGAGTKVPHLSYMGDVVIGRDTNVGAGTITCNYDPFELAPDGGTKHRTQIGNDVYISSDTMLVAPVRMGHGAQTGAGSVVTRNVGDGRLAYGVPATDRGPARKRAKRPSGTKGQSGKRKKGT